MMEPMTESRIDRRPSMSGALAVLLVLLAAAAALRASPEEREPKPFTEWTREEAVHVLTASPWIRQLSVTAPAADDESIQSPPVASSGRGGTTTAPPAGPSHRTLPITVTWVALPVREAHIRLAQFQGHMRDEKYWRPSVRGNPDIIQISIGGPGVAEFLRPGEDALRAGVTLRTKRGRTLTASGVVFAAEYPRVPEVTFTFPSQMDEAPALTPADDEVTLAFPLGGSRMSARFRLRDMVRHGQLLI